MCIFRFYGCCSIVKKCLTLCNPMDCSTPGFPVLHCPGVWSNSRLSSWWCHPTNSSSVSSFSSCPQSFPASRSNESALCIRWSKYWSFSFSISPFNEYSGWFPLGLTGVISLQSKGLSRVLSSTTVQKHQFFSAQISLWSNSHIHTWLLEKPLWLCRPLSAKWCLCFLIYCLGLSKLSFQGASVF